jgi:hypothetical protein
MPNAGEAVASDSFGVFSAADRRWSQMLNLTGSLPNSERILSLS